MQNIKTKTMEVLYFIFLAIFLIPVILIFIGVLCVVSIKIAGLMIICLIIFIFKKLKGRVNK
jgi:hypothetical protein